MRSNVIGIELSKAACRVVQLQRGGDPRATLVTGFASLGREDSLNTRALDWLRGHQAAVVVWGVRHSHSQVVVACGTYDAMRAEARAAVRLAGQSMRGVLADIAPVTGPDSDARRRTILLALASSADLNAALEPVVRAGIRVVHVQTPAAALLSLARARHTAGADGEERAEIYVALDQFATAITLIRGGTLLAETELTWGYACQPEGGGERADPAVVRPRTVVAEQLAADIEVFLAESGCNRGAVSQICVCGGMPGLRSMALPLVERLDVEVEPLDSLFAIDVDRLPEPAGRFRERASELRLAWAAAADERPALNLFRPRQRRAMRMRILQATAAAGLVAGLGAGWLLHEGLFPDLPPEVPPAARRG